MFSAALQSVSLKLSGFLFFFFAPKFLRVDQDKDKDCSLDCGGSPQKPLCASDGRTFLSRCEFQRAKCKDPQLEIAHRGSCKGEPAPRPAAAPTPRGRPRSALTGVRVRLLGARREEQSSARLRERVVCHVPGAVIAWSRGLGAQAHPDISQNASGVFCGGFHLFSPEALSGFTLERVGPQSGVWSANFTLNFGFSHFERQIEA